MHCDGGMLGGIDFFAVEVQRPHRTFVAFGLGKRIGFSLKMVVNLKIIPAVFFIIIQYGFEDTAELVGDTFIAQKTQVGSFFEFLP